MACQYVLSGEHQVIQYSTRGIIALGLAAKNWSVEHSRRQFEDLCHKAFTRRRGCSIPGVRWIIDKYNPISVFVISCDS